MVHYRIKISGRVQGVFFRATTKETADRLGIKGWARNEKDSSVLIEAEGAEHQMKIFVDWCHQGPRFAQVEQVALEEKAPEGYQDFSIKR